VDRHLHRSFFTFLSVLANSLLWAGEPAKLDRLGDPLPQGALARLGTTRLRHKGSVLALAFSADSSVLATTGMDDTVCVWQVSSGKKLLERKVQDYKLNSLDSIAISPDGKLLATVARGISQDEVTIHVWNGLCCQSGDFLFRNSGSATDRHSVAKRSSRPQLRLSKRGG
jgi:WD40 repeat protein